MTNVHKNGRDWIEVLKGSEIMGSPRSDDVTRICISLLDREIESFEYTPLGIYINLNTK